MIHSQEPDHPEEKAAPKKGKKSSKSAPKGEKATDAEMSWPRNLQDQQEEKSKKKKDQGTPFPFEVEVMWFNFPVSAGFVLSYVWL